MVTVSLKNISKKYKLFKSEKERFLELIHPLKKKYHKEFWALKNISFDVRKGEALGIVGCNGAGKSTLLKILCAIIHSTSGTIKTTGRIQSLLDLGAGFHPGVTGRNNVLIEGQVNGFSKKEAEELLPKIEAFADIGHFINAPTKTYSTGMLLRLAFATAIHIDPDILIIDEHLAVGDMKFQQKCYQKIKEFRENGKTIIFVSHDPHAIVKHADKAILLDQGSIIKHGNPREIIDLYHEFLHMNTLAPYINTSKPSQSFKKQLNEFDLKDFLTCENLLADHCIHRPYYNKGEHRFGDKRAEIVDYFICNNDVFYPHTLNPENTTEIYLKIKFHSDIEFPMIGFLINTVDGLAVYGNNTNFNKSSIPPAKAQDTIIFKLSMRLNLNSGHYFIDVGVDEKIDDLRSTPCDIRKSMIHIYVENKNIFDGLTNFDFKYEEVSRTNIHDGYSPTTVKTLDPGSSPGYK